MLTKQEKLLLLQLILEDIRGYWGWNLEKRLDEATSLSTELGLEQHLSAIAQFREQMEEGWQDGRFFRCSHEDGGYEGMEELHGLQATIIDKSTEFKNSIGVLTHPENRFDDWEEYYNYLLVNDLPMP